MVDEQLAEIRLGQYRLGELLASGGMGEVFHANCVIPSRMNRPIVLKRMHKHLAEDKKFVSMFVEEARISSLLDHPNIVQLFDFEATSEGLYIILEYIDGPDLLSLLKAGAKRKAGMPPEIAVYITCHLLEALDYAHNLEVNGKTLGIVHRDVSPGNILVNRHGRIKLADFGIASASDRQRGTDGSLKGKYGYMSPEQLAANPLDGRTDIFSAGIVLAELLMSKRLFSAPAQLDVLMMVRNANLVRLDDHGSHIDPALQTIIRKALKINKQNRYATAGEFRDALAGWLSKQKTRMSAALLNSYIRDLEKNGFMSQAARGVDTGTITISGTNTKAASLAALGAARRGRHEFDRASGSTLGTSNITHINGGAFLPDTDIEEPVCEEAISAQEALRRKSGELSSVLPLHLVGEIFAQKKTGLLTLASNSIVKQAYFVDGHPTVVHSNDPTERFGQYLIQRGLLTEIQLKKALKAAPHFGGHLGNTLVGLELLQPVDAVQLLVDQVSLKLQNSFCWDVGRYSWQEGKINTQTSIELKLNSCRQVAHGVGNLSEEQIGAWIDAHNTAAPDLSALAPFDAYGFGPSLSKRLQTMNGNRSIEDLLSKARKKSLPILGAAILCLYACNPELHS